MDIDIRKLKNPDVVESVVRENMAMIEKLIRAANRSWGGWVVTQIIEEEFSNPLISGVSTGRRNITRNIRIGQRL